MKYIAMYAIVFIFFSCAPHPGQEQKSPQSHYERGIQALQKKDFLTAEKELLTAIRDNDRNALAYSALGEVCLQCGRMPESWEYFQEALKIDPNHTQSWIGLARWELRNKNYKKSRKWIDIALDIDANHDEAHFVSGQIYLAENQPQSAVEEFQKTLSINPQHANAQLLLKGLLSSGGDTNDVDRAGMASLLAAELPLPIPDPMTLTVIKDIGNHRMHESIHRIVNLGIMELQDGKFLPKAAVTRSDLARIGQELIALSTGDSSLRTTFSAISTPFKDVKSTDAYFNAVILSTSYGLLDGFADGTFRPLTKIHHRDAAQFIENVKRVYKFRPGD